MTLDELERSSYWENDEYFDYMKETGNWGFPEDSENREDTGKPCDRCGQDGLRSWKVESYIDVDDVGARYTVATDFEFCLLCVLELVGSLNSGKQEVCR